MVIFHSYVSLPEGYLVIRDPKETRKIDEEWFTVGVLLGRSFMFVYFSWSAIGCFGVASSWSICGNLLKVAMCGRTIGSTYASWLLPFGSLEIVDLPIKYGDFHSFLYVYQRVMLDAIAISYSVLIYTFFLAGINPEIRHPQLSIPKQVLPNRVIHSTSSPVYNPFITKSHQYLHQKKSQCLS